MKLFSRNKKKESLKIDSFTKIERTRVLQGRFIPGVINNGGSYFFVNLEVFEDGLIDCWEMIDLDLFKRKISTGWVSPKIPNNEKISIHHLGSWTVNKGEWIFNKESFFTHIKEVIKELNPDFNNLYNCYGNTTKKIGNINVSLLGLADGKPIRIDNKNDYFSPKHKGDNFHCFFKTNQNTYSLVSINIFADSIIEISGIETPKQLKIEDFKNLVRTGEILTEIPINSQVEIYGLGKCILGECFYSEDINEKVNEIEDIISELNGNKTSSEICKEFYDKYLIEPSNNNKELLKNSYERIPEHLRIYVLHDMDNKDWPIRNIIYDNKKDCS